MFDDLWAKFPRDDDIKTLCYNKQSGANPSSPFDNYCAIRLSECFNRAQVSTSGLAGARCWSHKGQSHLLRAQDMAKAMSRTPPPGFGKAETIAAATFQSKLAGRKGVIFFGDYWRRGQESFENRSGDHIYLWNGSRTTGSSTFWREVSEFFEIVSDFNDSKRIWFWEVK